VRPAAALGVVDPRPCVVLETRDLLGVPEIAARLVA